MGNPDGIARRCRLPNERQKGSGVFQKIRRPEVSDQEFTKDAKSVEKDLAKLKTLLEK